MVKSNKSASTTNQTGDRYFAGFSTGFLEQNKTKILHGKWLGTNIDVKLSKKISIVVKLSKKRKLGEDSIQNKLGDIDFLCTTIVETNLTSLFPPMSRCDTSTISTIPAGTDIYMEVTSMSGSDAINIKKERESKVKKKVKFYENLFTTPGLSVENVVVDLDKKDKIVLFVFNGADFVELKKHFKSDKFRSSVIYFPMVPCVTWQSQLDNTRKDTIINRLMSLLASNNISVAPEILEPDNEDTEIDSNEE